MDTPVEQVPQQVEVTPIPNYSHHSFSRRPTFMYLFTALILMGGLGVGLVALNSSQDVRSKASNNGPTLALSPTAKTVKVGETFTVGVTMNTNADAVSAVELHLSYDPTAIQILKFTPTTQLPVVLVPETHANGAIAVTLAAKPPTAFKGAGIIGTWTAKVLAAKQSSIQFTSQTSVAALGKTTNALASQTGSTITGTSIRKAPNPTPIKKSKFGNIQNQ